jgi:nucleoside-diphosphate-sugar epimerase
MQKLVDAERLVRNFPGLIIRIITPLDDRPHPANLIDKLIKYPKIINLGGSATTVPHMIEALKKLINVKAEGIYNLTNPGIISPAEIMEMYRDIVDKGHQFEVIGPDELKEVTQVGRAICVLNTKKLESKGIKMPEIKKAVEECLIQYGRRLR